MSFSAQAVLESPEYYPLKFEGSNLVFVQMARNDYQQSIFTLPNRIVTANSNTWSVPFSQIVSLIENSGFRVEPPAVIFQIAHCGSTLLSRALDQAGSSLVIREPFALRQFCASSVNENQDARGARQRGLNALWNLLSRKYIAAETTLIKANVPVNYSLDEISTLAPKLKGILLYCSLSDYLLSVLKSEQRKLWAKHVVRELAAKIRSLDAFSNLDIATLTAAQATAVLWISQISNYQSALTANSLFRSLRSDLLFQKPFETLVACSQHLSLDISDQRIQEITAGELFSHHAKTPEREYSETDRVEEIILLREQYSDEIDSISQWCERSGFNIHPDLEQFGLMDS